MIYFVTYDLHQHGRDYDAVAAVLNSAQSAIHPMGSVWFIQSAASAGAWRDALREAGDENDEHFVARISPNDWASFNLDANAATWLNDPARTW
jgi:hypothetical protein